MDGEEGERVDALKVQIADLKLLLSETRDLHGTDMERMFSEIMGMRQAHNRRVEKLREAVRAFLAYVAPFEDEELPPEAKRCVELGKEALK